jgi:hypothetical protein
LYAPARLSQAIGTAPQSSLTHKNGRSAFVFLGLCQTAFGGITEAQDDIAGEFFNGPSSGRNGSSRDGKRCDGSNLSG